VQLQKAKPKITIQNCSDEVSKKHDSIGVATTFFCNFHIDLMKLKCLRYGIYIFRGSGHPCLFFLAAGATIDFIGDTDAHALMDQQSLYILIGLCKLEQGNA